MKLRALLKTFDLWLRPAHVADEHGEGYRPIDNVDAMTTGLGHTPTTSEGGGPVSAPPGWVPSQQDERPHR
jgi:hypothetical protein